MSCYPTRPFKEVCSLQKGKKPALQAERQSGSQPYLTARYMRGTEAPQWVPEVDKNAVKVQSHELIIICDGSNSGETFNGVEGILSSTMAKVTHGIDIDTTFLRYFLISKLEKYAKTKTGAAIPHLDLKGLREEKIPVPPFSEQQRIVGILDQVFEGIAEAKANAERNLANAKEMFESERESLFLEDAEAEERCFDEICDITSTLVDPREAAYQPMLHIGAGNIESDSGALSNVQSAAEEKLISGKFIFDESMVLYSKIRPYLKKVVAPEFRGLCSADIYPLTPNKNLIQRDYLYHMLLTKPFTEYAILGSERAGMPKVNRNHLFAYKVGVPDHARQTAVIGRLKDFRITSEKLCSNYKVRTRAIDELKSSILQQAFSGNL